ncbi:act minimal PKS acyl carrier protein [Kitasatospora sp. MAP12-15]|uniref:acyl carrier protein n=1 Tax=unclassified Kitasatospora TaxID=2633591 RepID=UPI00247327DD|nr:acyl carrier protein [Kitasatospora sp. MAP12-44]MDH6113742.1 act minimal PKS acyl carrier protein [Kitasatospora sp. MAP12-44]
MNRFSVDDLLRILRAGAGTDTRIEVAVEQLTDTPFAELGYDSLALLELTSRIEREYGIAIPDGEVEQKETPGQVVEYVNSLLTEVAC